MPRSPHTPDCANAYAGKRTRRKARRRTARTPARDMSVEDELSERGDDVKVRRILHRRPPGAVLVAVRGAAVDAEEVSARRPPTERRERNAQHGLGEVARA